MKSYHLVRWVTGLGMASGLLLGVGLLATVHGQPPRPNLVLNPGFEAGHAGYVREEYGAATTANFLLDASVARSGSRSLKVVNSTARGPNVYKSFVQVIPNLRPDTTFQISFWVRSEYSASKGAFGLIMDGALGGWKQRVFADAGAYDWTEFRGTYNIGRDDKLVLRFITEDACTVWLDDVQVVESASLAQDVPGGLPPQPLPASTATPVAGFVYSDGRHIYVLRDGDTGARRLTGDADGSNEMPVWSPDGRRIAFLSNRDHTAGWAGAPATSLYVMDADGSNARLVRKQDPQFGPSPYTGLTRQYALKPSWSPDGQTLAYVDAPGPGEPARQTTYPNGLTLPCLSVYLIGVDGTNRRAVTTPREASDFAPHWSPDGGRLLFFRAIPYPEYKNYKYEIWSIRPDGTGGTNLTPTTLGKAPTGRVRYPRWSPDGRSFLFQDGHTAMEVWLADADGGNVRKQTALAGLSVNSCATWSPEGTQIAFSTAGGVWRKSLNSPHLEPVPGVLSDFDWSPVPPDRPIPPPPVPGGAEAIACVGRFSPTGESTMLPAPYVPPRPYSVNAGGDDIFVMSPDGKDRLDVTKTGDCDERTPAWSPDRARIALSSNWPHRAGTFFHIFAMDPDGRNAAQLTNGPAHDHHPAWSPDGQRLAFLRHALNTNQGEIWVLNANGTNPQRVLGPSYGGVGATGKISWSPAGTRIAYQDIRGPWLCIVDLVGLPTGGPNRVTRLTSTDEEYSSPAWSTNPAILAAKWRHSVAPDRHFSDIVLLNVAGGPPAMVTDGDTGADYPTWSPGGTRIAFQKQGGVFVTNANGTGRPVAIREGQEPDWGVGPAAEHAGDQHKDVGKKIEDALQKAGAKSGEVQISLHWASKDDLDLHVVCPSGEEIYYGNRSSQSGGTLDVDMNVVYDQAVSGAVENVFWPQGKAAPGQYKVYVNLFSDRADQPGCADPCPFNVRVAVQGQSQVVSGTVSRRENRQRALVHEFTLR